MLPSHGQVPASWQTYRDPAGYFTIRAPAQWHVSSSTGQSTTGDRTGSFSTTDEYVSIGTNDAPLLGTGIAIYVQPLPNAFARQWTCENRFGSSDGSLAGLPASYQDWTWFLDTNAAHYQINTSFPGGGSPHSSPAMPANQPLPTPVPQATVTANEQLIELVVSAFQPTPATPLAC